MRWSTALMIAPFISLAVAISSVGSRLLVVNEDTTNEKKYSQFFSDLKSKLGACFDLKVGY